jgi:hypothetical protein
MMSCKQLLRLVLLNCSVVALALAKSVSSKMAYAWTCVAKACCGMATENTAIAASMDAHLCIHRRVRAWLDLIMLPPLTITRLTPEWILRLHQPAVNLRIAVFYTGSKPAKTSEDEVGAVDLKSRSAQKVSLPDTHASVIEVPNQSIRHHHR